MYRVAREVAAPPAAQVALRPRWSRTDWVTLFCTLVVVAFVCFGQSVMKRFWYDELVTVGTGHLQTLGQIYHFFQSGQDTTSFLPSMLVHLCQSLPGKREVVLRLPFTLAYLGACAGVWVVLRRRYPAGFASAAVFLFPQGVSLFFASEARAYSFLFLGTAIALVCWQTANREDRWRGLATWGVFAGLALAILFHFFAIFLWVPFVFAEWIYRRETGRTRIGMWLAIVLFPAAIGVMLPNLLSARHVYGGTFWSKPTVGLLTDCYTIFMEPMSRDLGEIIVLVAVVLWFRARPRGSRLAEMPESQGFTRPEWVLMVGLSVVPFVAFVGARVLNVFRWQYVMYFQIGLLILLFAGIAELVQRRRDAGWVLAGVMLGLMLFHARDFLKQGVNELAGKPTEVLPADFGSDWYEFIKPIPLPVVADGSLVLYPVEYYAPADLRQRLYILTSHQRSLLQPMSVTTELNMEVFGRTLDLPVVDYDQFVAQHHDFLLIVSPKWISYSWLFHYLLNESGTKHDVHLEHLWGDPMQEVDQIYLVHFGPPEPALYGAGGGR